MLEGWTGKFYQELNARIRRGRLEAAINAGLSTLTIGSPLVLLLVGGVLVQEGRLSLGTMLALNALAIGFLNPLNGLVQAGLQLQVLGGYLDRIEDVMSSPTEHSNDGNLATSWSYLRGAVRLRNVTFRYLPGAEPAIRNLSLDLESGSLAAIVGASGSGKSTLAGLVAGLLVPTSGELEFDDRSLSELDLRQLRSQIGFVPQKPFLLTGTIRDNLSFFEPSVPMSRIVEHARHAGIHEEIMALSQGYDTPIAAGGSSLSGGQSQRITLARAFVQEPQLLVLDEATNALDFEMECRIHRYLSSLECTRVVVTHRLSTIRKADIIYVLEHGELVEFGGHLDLEAEDGVYRRLLSSASSANEGAA